MRDKHRFHGFTRASLIFGSFGLALSPSAQRCPDGTPVINRTDMQWFYDQFVPAEQRRAPDVSPLWADLRDLPPTLFTVGTLDPLLDDTLFMHDRRIAAGNPADLAIYPGGVHGFVLCPYALAQRARQRMIEFLKE
jgi:acetyl esterase